MTTKQSKSTLKLKPLFTAIVIVFGFSVYAQEFSLQGKVVDENNQPLSYVTLLLAKFSGDGDNLSGLQNPKGTATNLVTQNYLPTSAQLNLTSAIELKI